MAANDRERALQASRNENEKERTTLLAQLDKYNAQFSTQTDEIMSQKREIAGLKDQLLTATSKATSTIASLETELSAERSEKIKLLTDSGKQKSDLAAAGAEIKSLQAQLAEAQKGKCFFLSFIFIPVRA